MCIIFFSAASLCRLTSHHTNREIINQEKYSFIYPCLLFVHGPSALDSIIPSSLLFSIIPIIKLLFKLKPCPFSQPCGPRQTFRPQHVPVKQTVPKLQSASLLQSAKGAHDVPGPQKPEPEAVRKQAQFSPQTQSGLPHS